MVLFVPFQLRFSVQQSVAAAANAPDQSEDERGQQADSDHCQNDDHPGLQSQATVVVELAAALVVVESRAVIANLADAHFAPGLGVQIDVGAGAGNVAHEGDEQQGQHAAEDGLVADVAGERGHGVGQHCHC